MSNFVVTDVRTYKNRWEVDVKFFREKRMFRPYVEEIKTFYQKRYFDDRISNILWTDAKTFETPDSWLRHELSMAVYKANNKNHYETLVAENNDKVQ